MKSWEIEREIREESLEEGRKLESVNTEAEREKAEAERKRADQAEARVIELENRIRVLEEAAASAK